MLLDRLRLAVDPLPAPGAGVHPEISAAVLLLVDPTDPALPLLFIRRTREVPTHRGQIAFPGGRHGSVRWTVRVALSRAGGAWFATRDSAGRKSSLAPAAR